MRTQQLRRTAAAIAALALALVAGGPASADPPPRSDHGHILVLDVETLPGSFPPVPISARRCIDLADNQPVPRVAHHDQRHTGPDGGVFTARTGHIVIPTWPYEAFGEAVPWHDCDDFMTMFGLG